MLLSVIGSVSFFRLCFYLCDTANKYCSFVLTFRPCPLVLKNALFPGLTLLQGRLACGILGFIILASIFCGSTLIGGVHSEKHRFSHGILTHNFALTGFLVREGTSPEEDHPANPLSLSLDNDDEEEQEIAEMDSANGAVSETHSDTQLTDDSSVIQEGGSLPSDASHNAAD